MMRSTMNDVHSELNTRFNEFTESRLAILLLNHLDHFDSVRRVSASIVKLLSENEKAVVKVIDVTPAILRELKHPYFGACWHQDANITTNDIFTKMLEILSDNNRDYSAVMQVHCIFIHRIFDHLKPDARTELCQRIFPDTLITETKSSRREYKEKTVLATRQLGISRHPVFARMLGKSAQVHVRALDRFSINTDTSFFKAAALNHTPVVCGPSGHTRTLLLGAMLYGNLNAAEMKEYTLAIFAFLAAGGNHSLHEVLVVAREGGMEMDNSNYLGYVPDSIGTEKTSNALFP